jgi:hypothetical protein
MTSNNISSFHCINLLRERVSNDTRFAIISLFATPSMATVIYTLDSKHLNYDHFYQDPSLFVELVEEVRSVIPFKRYSLSIDEKSKFSTNGSSLFHYHYPDTFFDLQTLYQYMNERVIQASKERDKGNEECVQVWRVHQKFHFPISSETFVELGFHPDSTDISVQSSLGNTSFAYEYRIGCPQRIRIDVWIKPGISDMDKNGLQIRGIEFRGSEERMSQLREALYSEMHTHEMTKKENEEEEEEEENEEASCYIII